MILITGGTGFIGRSLSRALAERPHKLYQGRINDPLTLRQELEGVTHLFHLAGAERRGRARLLAHVDVEGTQRLVEECQRAGVVHLIVPSRLGADPHALSPLLRAKGEVERVVRQGAVPYTILRAATLFGRHDAFLNAIASLAAWSWPVVWVPGGGKVLMQPWWVEDYVRCLIATLDRPDLGGKTLSLAGSEQLHYHTIVEQVLTVTGLRRHAFTLRLHFVRPIAALTFRWWSKPPVSRFYMDRLSTPDICDPQNVNQHFGFRPSRLHEHVAFLRQPGWRNWLRHN